ncbi:ABC transporter ATP-binding protein [Thiomicrorhabdus sp.]|uniref:ABC transporter ATP-binding protein n=1 Tax=Thiomicrorhabdus sp. TaxID=2039724 RepID=UPI0029C630FE|nr:ABC transporter ATP-binding protein [Thiomicrorhabdus sp.]
MSSNIWISDITHFYTKKQTSPTLDDINLTIPQGQLTALIGRSGCGKSTLLQMIAGLLMPSDGAVRINGHTVTKPSAKWNMMFQKPSLYPWMTVRENAALGLVFAGTYKEKRDRVEELLDMVGLSEHKDKNVQQLSGGQQQRVALARSLATEPDVLLLDEPFSALDAFTRSALQTEVAQICHDYGITMVLVTHDIEEAVAMADKVVIMNHNPGKIVGSMDVPLAYPRDRGTEEFSELKDYLFAEFEKIDQAKQAELAAIESQQDLQQTQQALAS